MMIFEKLLYDVMSRVDAVTVREILPRKLNCHFKISLECNRGVKGTLTMPMYYILNVNRDTSAVLPGTCGLWQLIKPFEFS